jgi:radical SAM superfamily enzyme YgiQ (UPF0313 family)
MRVLLVSCYELGHQPLGLCGPAGALLRAGCAVDALDLAVERLDPARIGLADVVAISVPMHTALRMGIELLARVRALSPGCQVVFYGLYAGLNADALLARGADAVVGAEAEAELAPLVAALVAGRAASRRVDWRHAPSAPRPQALVPFRDPLPALDRYARALVEGEARVSAAIEASRGCRHLCRHCPIPPVYRGRFFVTPVEDVLAQVEDAALRGARHITFADPDFLNGPGHARRIARGFGERFPDLSFDITAKIEHLVRHAALLPELSRAGCAFVVSAVESLSDTVLAHLDKGHTRADVACALAATRAAGLALRPSLLAFTPWTTPADYLDVLDWVEDEGLQEHVDAVQYTIRLLVPPGSLLCDYEPMQRHLGPLDHDRFTFEWRHPDRRMDTLSRAIDAAVRARVGAERSTATLLSELRQLVADVTGLARPRPQARAARHPRPVPRLTEPWFC